MPSLQFRVRTGPLFRHIVIGQQVRPVHTPGIDALARTGRYLPHVAHAAAT